MKRDKKSRTRTKQRRRMMIESLESRQLLAVDGIRIDLSGSGGTDLLGIDGGGSVHEGYLNRPVGQTLTTGNVPGQNNKWPVAGADSHVMGQNDPAVEFLIADLISNDIDPDSTDPLTFTGIDATDSLGNVTYDEANGRVIYDPSGKLNFVSGGQTGTDTFRYTVADAKGGIGQGTVTITINGVNDAPTFTAGADVTVDEDAGPQILENWATDVTDGDSGADGLVFEVTDNSNAGLFRVAPAIDAAGNLTFTPADNAFGDAELSVRINDGQASDNLSTVETFKITVNRVNDAPSFTPGADVIIDEDGGPQTLTHWATDVTDGDSESDGLVFEITDNTNAGLFSVAPAIDAAGNLTFTPAENAFGVAELSVRVNDGQSVNHLSPSAILKITINGVNDPPSFTPGSDVTVDEDAGPQTVTHWATDVTDGDLESDGLVFEMTGNTNADLFAVAPAIDAEGNLTFTPAENAFGVAQLSVRIDDRQTSDNLSAVENFTITVNSVNDAPSFTPGADIEVDEDAGPQTVTHWATDVTDGDSESDGLVFEITGNTNAGLFAVAPAIDGAGQLTFSPAENAFGVAEISVRINDGQTSNHLSAVETFTITIASVNDAPSFTPGSDVTVDEDSGPQTMNHWATEVTDGDSETDGLVFEITGNTNTGLFAVAPAIDTAGHLTFTPAENAFGVAEISVRIDDGQTSDHLSTVETFTITVNSVNDAPSFTPGGDIEVDEDAGQQSVAHWATNVTDGDSGSDGLVFEITGNSNAGLFAVAPAIDGAGQLTFTSAENAFGVAEISVRIDDGQASNHLSAVETFTITVNSVNDAPSFTPGGDVTVDEDAGPQTVTHWATEVTDGDSETDGLAFEITGNTNQGLFAVAPVIDGAGQLTFTPAENAFGVAEISVRIDDGQASNHLSAVETFTITVNSVNDAPSFTPGGDVTVDEDAGPQTVTHWATDVTDGDSESDGLVFEITGNTNQGLFAVAPVIDGAGHLSFTPAENAFGVAEISVRIDDGQTSNHLSAVETFTIAVNSVNDAPSFTPGGDVTVAEDSGTKTVTQWATDVTDGDSESDGLVFEITGNTNTDLFAVAPAIDAAGNLTFTPAENASGVAEISVRIDDGQDSNRLSPVETFTIAVYAVNDAPSFEISESNLVADLNNGERTMAGFVHGIESGPDDEAGQAVTVSITGNSNPEIFASGPTLDADGALTFVPAAVGTATLTLTATDDGLSENGGVDTSAPIQFTITISETMQNKYPIDGYVDFSGMQTRTESLVFDVSDTSSSVTIGFDNDDRHLYIALEWADDSFDNHPQPDPISIYDEVVLQIDANGNSVHDPGEDYRQLRAVNSGSDFKDSYFDGVREQVDSVGDGLAKLKYDPVREVYQAEFMIPLADDIHGQDSTITDSSRFQLTIRDGYRPYDHLLNQAIAFTESDLPFIPIKEPAAFYDHPELPTDLTGLIVYVSTHEEPSGEIYTFDPATGVTFRVTHNTLAENSVSLSRDRTKIAFHAFVEPGVLSSLEIFSIDVDGSDLQQLTDDEYANAHPAWSPDGERLSYSRIAPGLPGITIISSSGEFIRDLTPEGIEDHDAEYLPDGRIVFKTTRWSSAPEYLTGVMNEDGTNVQQLTFVDNVSDHDQFGNDRAVIFERFPKGTDYQFDPDGLTIGWDLIEVPLDGSGEITLLSDGWMNTTPVYDPTGEYILYMKGPAYFEASLMTRTGEVLGRFIPDVTQIKFIDWR